MIRSYLKSAVRNLWMHRGFSFINIAGLSIGLASSFIIMLYSIHEVELRRLQQKSRRHLVSDHRMDPERVSSADYAVCAGPGA